MHSKVVIASLVCMLAASFGAGNKVTSDFKKTNREAKEMVCRAPNDDECELVFVNDITSTNDEARALFTSNRQIANARVMKTTPGVIVRFTLTDNGVRVFITPDATKTKQAVALAFTTAGSKKTAKTYSKTVYIYNDGQNCCFSALSEADVMAKHFMNFVATSEQLADLANGSPSFEGTSPGIVGPELPDIPDPHPDPHPDPWPPFPNPNPPRVKKGFVGGKEIDFIEPSFLFDPFTPGAEESYVNFIFGDKQDMEFTVSTVSNSGISQRFGTGLNAQVNWYDENNVMHPAKGVSVQFYGNGQLLTDFGHIFSQEPMSYDYRTNANGYCNVDVRSDCRLNLIEARVCADSSSTRVEDNFMIDYPFFARASSDPFAFALSDYIEVNFTINIYSKKSERGEAFAMSQMQNVPYDYCAQFSDGVDAVKTIYPSAHTYYDGANDTIMVQPEDKKSWDVLHHEYGHHIADQLELSSVSNSRVAHGVFEDLNVTHGDNAGRQLAYSEGLATYLGIASQMFYSNRYNFAGYGDEIYQDSFRNLEVDYGEFDLGGNRYDEADGVEARVTSILVKLLDDEERYVDEISLGHQNMFNLIMNAGSSNATIHDFVSETVDMFPELAADVYDLLEAESIPNLSLDAWTILIYASVNNWTDEIYNDINEILSVANKPDNVNIIIEMGGYRQPLPPANYPISPTNIGRYHVENQQLIRDESLPDANMGEEETFEAFLEWGLVEYPARNTGIILWGPGNGIEGVCGDTEFYSTNFLNADEIWHAINEVLVFEVDYTDSLEFIGYDSGYAQLQDAAAFNSDFFKYMISTQSMKTADGWAYDEMLERIYDYENNDTLDVLQAISNYYYQYCMDNDYTEASMSILDLSYMREYRIKFETLIATIGNIAIANYQNRQEFAAILCGPDTKRFGDGSTADGYSFLRQLSYSSTYAAYYYQIIDVIEGYQRVVIDNKQSYVDNDIHGLSLPIHYNGYEGVTRFQNWKALMLAPANF